jgi:hypothetical protein
MGEGICDRDVVKETLGDGLELFYLWEQGVDVLKFVLYKVVHLNISHFEGCVPLGNIRNIRDNFLHHAQNLPFISTHNILHGDSLPHKLSHTPVLH